MQIKSVKPKDKENKIWDGLGIFQQGTCLYDKT